MQPSLTIPLHRSSIHWVPISPVVCIISATSPYKPGALCLFIFFNAAAISSILIQSAGPSLTVADILWSHSFSSFISFSMYSFHVSLIPFSSTVTLPDTSFRQFDPVISYLSFTICFAIQKISFCWLGSFRSLANSFCSKLLTKWLFSILFTLIVLLCLCWFFFLQFSILFLLFPYCFSNFLIPPPCFLMPAWAFWQSTCDLCCIHHYIFSSVASVHFHQCIRYLIFDHAFVFFTYFSSLSFHTRTLGSNFLRHLFLELNRMSITNYLCFGTHSSFRMTLTLRTFGLSSCCTII